MRGIQTGCVDFKSEHAIDQPKRAGERVGRYPVPQGPVYGRGVGEIYRSFRRVGDGKSFFPVTAMSTGLIRRFALKTASIPVNDQVAQYQDQRQTKYALVKPRRLQILLEKLARYGSTRSDRASRELAEKRRKEAEMLSRIYPGESR